MILTCCCLEVVEKFQAEILASFLTSVFSSIRWFLRPDCPGGSNTKVLEPSLPAGVKVERHQSPFSEPPTERVGVTLQRHDL